MEVTTQLPSIGMVLCFGELLLRWSPQLNGEWIREAAMPIYLGGAELNVAMTLAAWNRPVRYVTALPDNYLSKEICDYLTKRNIDVSGIQYGGERIGAYYLPQGTDLKHAGVIYDRAHSSFSKLTPGQIDWDQVLEGCSWFHFSAISPALNAQSAAVCREAVEAASKRGLTVSVDLNYRAKLWQYGKQPIDIIPELVNHCDIVMGNIWAAEKMLGIAHHLQISGEKESCLEQSLRTSEEIIRLFPRCRQVANTFRFDKGDGITYLATLYEDSQLYGSREYGNNNIVDKVGSGDCFMAGLIYGNQCNLQWQETIDLAAAAAVTKLSITGDSMDIPVHQIKKTFGI